MKSFWEDHMNQKSHVCRWLATCICSLLLIPAISMGESNIDPSDEDARYAYGENVGWANLKPDPRYGVTLTDTQVSGYIWCENIGWVDLNPLHGGVQNDGIGNLSGWAWGENVGWISLSCATTSSCDNVRYGIRVDPETGVFSGFAWGENIGWLSFSPADTSSFSVTSAWRDDVRPGDLNDDGAQGLDDVIIGLQLCAGQRPPVVLHLLADLNNDRQLGLADVLSILANIASESTSQR